MQKILLVCVLAAAGAAAVVGCKESSSSSTAASTSDDTSGRPARSGKIDIGPRRPATPDTADQGSGSDKPTLPDQEERRKERLSKYDKDGDGKISEEERKAARHQRAEDMLKKADTNGDGKVTPDELANSNGFRRLDPQAIDTNKDGVVSVEELEAALEARGRQWGAGRRFDPAGRLGRTRDGAGGGSGSAN